MRILATFKVFDTITRYEDIQKLREGIGRQVGQIVESGKLVEGGITGDGRGGFLLLDVSSGAELQSLLGEGLLDTCHVETHPVVSFKELGEFFEKLAKKR